MEVINEQQRAELEAASIRLEQITAQITIFEGLLTIIQDAIDNKLVVLNTLAQTDINKIAQTLEGTYYFGDEVPIDGSIKIAHVVFGPTSRLEVRGIPKRTYDAVPKVYVDNIISPLYTQLSRAISTRKGIFLTLRKSEANTDLALTSVDILSSSDDYISVFTLGSQEITFKLGGVYQISWNLASSDFSSLMTPILKLDNVEIGKLYLSGIDSGIISLALNINKDSVLSWFSSNTPFTILSNTLSIVRLGD